MKWSYWIELYIRTHCVARGLRPLTLAAYEHALKQFHEWVRVTRADIAPDQVTARDVLAYLQYLREVRGNGGVCREPCRCCAAAFLLRDGCHGIS
jgi:site-specific recombinase XerD